MASPLFFAPSNRLMIRLFIINRTGLRKMRKLIDPRSGKEVILIPTAHLERASYYDEIRCHLDCLKEDGHVVFYEGVVMPTGGGSLADDLLMRKFRRVMGFFLTGYKNSANKSIPSSIRNNKYTEQTRENLGLTTERDIHVDMTLSALITEYERDKGEILLTDYDLSTGLLDEYDPPNPESGNFASRRNRGKDRKSRNVEAEDGHDEMHQDNQAGNNMTGKNGAAETRDDHDMYYLIRTLRDRYVAGEVINSNYRKIVLLYGKLHLKAIYRILKEAGFRKAK